MDEIEAEINGPFVDMQPVPTLPGDPERETPPETVQNEEVPQLPIPDDPSEV